MSAIPNPRQGAARPADRCTRRNDPPVLPLRWGPDSTPSPSRLLLFVGATPYVVRIVPREPGDEALLIVKLIDPDGVATHAGDLGDGYECDCPAHGRGVAPELYCEHVRALLSQGVFGPIVCDDPVNWPDWTDEAWTTTEAILPGGAR